MKKTTLLLALLASLTACDNNNNDNDVNIPHQAQVTDNIYITHFSTFPRSSAIGLISVDAGKKNIESHIYSYNAKKEKIYNNIYSEGSVPIYFDNQQSATSGGSSNAVGGSGSSNTVDGSDSKVYEHQELSYVSDIINQQVDKKTINLVIEDTFIRASLSGMTPEALVKLNSITVLLEGAGSIVAKADINNLVKLAKEAELYGVKHFYIKMFSGINVDVLKQQSPLWEQLLSNPFVTLSTIDFNKINKEIDTPSEIDAFKSLLSHFDYDISKSFVKSKDYDNGKKLLVFFGSARDSLKNSSKSRAGGNYNNMLLVDHYLADPEITSNYNFAFKPHPKLDWINSYIRDNQPAASYFSSIPFELLAMAAGKDINGTTIPEIDRVDSVYSSILFTVGKDKINTIVDYSPSSYYQGEKDSVDFMKNNYSLDDGWGIPEYQTWANDFKRLVNDSSHIKVTNTYQFINS